MAVNIIWSLSNGGDALSTTLDHSNASNGNYTTEKEIFIRHDGLNSITDAGLYIRQLSGTYSGSFTAAADIAELLYWGDQSTSSTFGGFQCNLLATTSYPSSGWPTYSSKSPTGGFVHRTGVGDSESNAIAVPTTTGATSSGTIQAGSSPNVRLKVRILVPTDEDTIGIRQWDQVLKYNFTS